MTATHATHVFQGHLRFLHSVKFDKSLAGASRTLRSCRLSFSACLVASRLLGFSASRLVSYFSASRLLGFSACFVLLGFSASGRISGPLYPCIEKLRLTNKARTPCFCSLQRSGFYVRRFQLLPLKVSECCGAFCGRPPGATAQSSSYQENQQQEPRLGVRCTKTEFPISSPSPK